MKEDWKFWICRIVDATETFKYLHNIYSVDSSTLTLLSQPTGGVITSGHKLKLQKRDNKISMTANVLGFHTVNFWNDHWNSW